MISFDRPVSMMPTIPTEAPDEALGLSRHLPTSSENGNPPLYMEIELHGYPAGAGVKVFALMTVFKLPRILSPNLISA